MYLFLVPLISQRQVPAGQAPRLATQEAQAAPVAGAHILGVLGHPPSSRARPYSGKPSPHSQTSYPPSPQFSNTYGSMALSQARGSDIQFTETVTMVLFLCPTVDSAGSLSNAIYSSELHFKPAAWLCWLQERALV